MQLILIRLRPRLEAVARRTDLDLSAKNEKQFDNLITSLAARVSVAGTSRDNIYEIKFTSKDPARAKQVVDELLNTFLENALGNNRTDTAVTKKFLDEQIAEYEKRLIEAEDRLKEFKQRNVGKMPGEGGGYYARLESQRAELKQARLELTEAVRRRDELNKQLGGNAGKTGDTLPGAPTETEYSARIESLETNLDQLLLQYTEKHPDVIATRSTLERLKGKHEEELELLIKQFKQQPLLSDSGSHSAATTKSASRWRKPKLRRRRCNHASPSMNSGLRNLKNSSTRSLRSKRNCYASIVITH